MPERWSRAISLVTFAILAAVVVLGPLNLVAEGSYIWVVILFPAWKIVRFVVTRLVLLDEHLAASRRNPSGFTFRYLKPNASRTADDSESGHHTA